MLVVWVVKTLFWRQTHINPNRTFRRTSPALSSRPKETSISQNYPACEHADQLRRNMSGVRQFNECACVLRDDSQKLVPIDSGPVRRIIEHIMNRSAKIGGIAAIPWRATACLPTGRRSPGSSTGRCGPGRGPATRRPAREVFAAGWSAGGFAVLLALLAARASLMGKEVAFLDPGPITRRWSMARSRRTGLAELGGDPRQPDPGAHQNRRRCACRGGRHTGLCPHVGRRAAGSGRHAQMPGPGRQPAPGFRGGESGVTILPLRNGAQAEPSAALTRWQVTSATSRADDDDWGAPVFGAQLTRHRLGGLGNFSMKWNLKMPVSKRRILALWFPRLPADRFIRRNGGPFEAPLVVSLKTGNALHVHALEMRGCQTRQLYKGQPSANARAMVQPLKIVPADERADAALLEGIADWCDRFTRRWSAWIPPTDCSWTLPARRICSAARRPC